MDAAATIGSVQDEARGGFMRVRKSGALCRWQGCVALARGCDRDATRGQHGAKPDSERERQVLLIQTLRQVSACVCAAVRRIENDEELRLRHDRGARRQGWWLLCRYLERQSER